MDLLLLLYKCFHTDNWLHGKLKSLDLLIRKTLIDNSENVQAKTQKNTFTITKQTA